MGLVRRGAVAHSTATASSKRSSPVQGTKYNATKKPMELLLRLGCFAGNVKRVDLNHERSKSENSETTRDFNEEFNIPDHVLSVKCLSDFA